MARTNDHYYCFLHLMIEKTPFLTSFSNRNLFLPLSKAGWIWKHKTSNISYQFLMFSGLSGGEPTVHVMRRNSSYAQMEDLHWRLYKKANWITWKFCWHIFCRPEKYFSTSNKKSNWLYQKWVISTIFGLIILTCYPMKLSKYLFWGF